MWETRKQPEKGEKRRERNFCSFPFPSSLAIFPRKFTCSPSSFPFGLKRSGEKKKKEEVEENYGKGRKQNRSTHYYSNRSSFFPSLPPSLRAVVGKENLTLFLFQSLPLFPSFSHPFLCNSKAYTIVWFLCSTVLPQQVCFPFPLVQVTVNNHCTIMYIECTLYSSYTVAFSMPSEIYNNNSIGLPSPQTQPGQCCGLPSSPLILLHLFMTLPWERMVSASTSLLPSCRGLRPRRRRRERRRRRMASSRGREKGSRITDGNQLLSSKNISNKTYLS